MHNASVEAIVDVIGEKVRQCRKEAGLSLNQLAQKARVSPAAIHKIEKREMIPSITVLMKIARALNKGISFFAQEESDLFRFEERVEVVRRESRRLLTSPSGSHMEVLAMFLEGGQLEVCNFTFGPGAKSGMRSEAHKGEEFFLITEGEMSFVVEEDVFVLREGDSIHFNSERPHRWENTGAGPLRLLWGMTPLPISSLERWIP